MMYQFVARYEVKPAIRGDKLVYSKGDYQKMEEESILDVWIQGDKITIKSRKNDQYHLVGERVSDNPRNICMSIDFAGTPKHIYNLLAAPGAFAQGATGDLSPSLGSTTRLGTKQLIVYNNGIVTFTDPWGSYYKSRTDKLGHLQAV